MYPMKTSGDGMNEAYLPEALTLANEAWLYDNSGDAPRMVMESRDGIIVWYADDEPAWAAQVRKVMQPDRPATN